MTVRDIIYLDEARLSSLVSQSAGFLEEFVTQTDHDERVRALQQSSDEAVSFKRTVSGQTDLKHGRFLDSRWTRFLDELHDRIEDLGESVDVETVAERALAEGKLVSASGTFFLDDFGWIQSSMSGLPTFIDFQELQSKSVLEAQLAAFSILKQSGQAKRDVEANKQKIQAQLAALTSQMNSQRESFKTLTKLVSVMFGDGVECGVSLVSGSMVRGVLDRAWLREPGPTLIERYGSRSTVGFTIVGLVTRLGWSERVHLSDDERSGWESVKAKGIEGEPNELPTSSARGAVGAAQAIMESVRSLLTGKDEEKTIFVAPLAIFRPITFEESTGASDSVPSAEPVTP